MKMKPNKKTTLTFTLLLLHTLCFSQYGGYDSYNQTSPYASIIGYFILWLIVFAVIFLLVRQIMLWYWKVNVIIKNQEETNFHLQNILSELQSKNKEESRSTIIHEGKNEQPALNPAVEQSATREEENAKVDNLILTENIKEDNEEPQGQPEENPVYSDSNTKWLWIVILTLLAIVILFIGYQFYKNTNETTKQSTQAFESNWSEADKNKIIINLGNLIDNSGDYNVINKKEEVIKCILDDAISKYPEVEDFKREMVDDENMLTDIIKPCLEKYNLNER